VKIASLNSAETRVMASMSQIGVVISEIYPNKLKFADSLKSGITFVDVCGHYTTCLFSKIKK